MGSIGIVADSNSSITPQAAKKLGIRILPMPFYIDGECYYEDVTLTRTEFFRRMAEGADITTSQPSPMAVTALWDEALKEYDQILYFPMTSGLSGSCAVAAALARDKYEGKVYVVDNGRISTPMHRSILDAMEFIRQGYSAEAIRQALEKSGEDVVIYIAVDTLQYLKKGGRITPAAAAIGTVLNIKPVLKLGTGNIDAFAKCRGMKKAKALMIETVKKDMQTRFQEQYERGELYLMSATGVNEEENAQWIAEIQAAFPDMPVMSDLLSLSVCCHTGYGVLGIGFSCRTRQPEQ